MALALAVSHQSIATLVPGLVLQGVGLGIVLTVNDPVGLSAVPADNAGEAAGMINTAEQLGGAIGVTGFLALEYEHYLDVLFDRLGERGIHPTQAQLDTGREFLQRAEEAGLHNVPEPALVQRVFSDITAAHVDGFRLAFAGSAAVALVGAALCLVLVGEGRRLTIRIRSRRSRWILANIAARSEPQD